MGLPRLILTGASGFLGRHLLEELRGRWSIDCIARRSQKRCGAPLHETIRWHQADIADREALGAVFDRIGEGGPADAVVHLAAHYDFTGDHDPEYERTNVTGLRHVLELCRRHRARRFVFSSSLAACGFPPPGGVLDESSPPDGEHIYAVTKARGEAMLAEYADAFPSSVVRFAAMFSDWCEYPPLFVFLGTWLSGAWNRRVLGGRGDSAIPYLHVRDGTDFVTTLIERGQPSPSSEVLIASTDGAATHEELFRAATEYVHGRPLEPIRMPRPLCRLGMRLRMLAGRLSGSPPFERPWMADYIDRALTVDASRTRARLGWQPRERLHLTRRLPFLLENYRTDPAEWHQRNRAAMKQARQRPNLLIHRLLERHEEEINRRFTAALLDPDNADRFPDYATLRRGQHDWNHRLALRHLLNAVRTRDRQVFMGYCGDLAAHRGRQGYAAAELCDALEELERICRRVLAEDPDAAEVVPYLHVHLTTTVTFGCDRVIEVFEDAEWREARGIRSREGR